MQSAAQVYSPPPVPDAHSGGTPRGKRWLRILSWLLASLIAFVLIVNFVIWPWISRWGATAVEATKPLPGDELVPDPMLVTTKAITVNGTPADLWPWLLQLGVDRGGMYSYLWVENWLLRLNVTNVTTIHEEWQQLQVGDFIRFTPQDFALNPGPGLYVLQLEPNRALIGCFGMEDTPPDCTVASTWQFILEPQSATTTRLILRSQIPGVGTPAARFGGKIGALFQFYMERKMLLTLKLRAEELASQH